jgi:hypothetical protein
MVIRAPVPTLWTAVVAEVLGFEHDEALTLGRAVAGLNAYSKGVFLGLFQPTPREVKEQRWKMRKEETVTVDLLHRNGWSREFTPAESLFPSLLLLAAILSYRAWRAIGHIPAEGPTKGQGSC